MSRQPDPPRSITVNEWWEKLDLSAPLETDLVVGAHRELLFKRREDEYILPNTELGRQIDYFTSRLDEYIECLRELPCNRSSPHLGRFVVDLRLYSTADEQIERRALVELRDPNGRNLVVAGERLRSLPSGCGALDIAFLGDDENPTIDLLLSPKAYVNELTEIERALKTPVGQTLLEGGSALYCLMRERIARRHGPEVGWESLVTKLVPNWAGEETSFVFHFGSRGTITVHPEYIADLCEIVVRTRDNG